MSLALVEAQFIQFLKKEGLPIMKAVLNIEFQNDEAVWVLGEGIIIIVFTLGLVTWSVPQHEIGRSSAKEIVS